MPDRESRLGVGVDRRRRRSRRSRSASRSRSGRAGGGLVAAAARRRAARSSSLPTVVPSVSRRASFLRALTVPPVSIAAMLDRGLVEEVLTRRSPTRRRLRRGLRRGDHRHLDPARRRQGRGAHHRARPRRGRARRRRARATATRSRTGSTAMRCSRPPRPRAPRCATARRGRSSTSRTLEGPLTNAVERPAGDVPAADKVAWLRELDDVARGRTAPRSCRSSASTATRCSAG